MIYIWRLYYMKKRNVFAAGAVLTLTMCTTLPVFANTTAVSNDTTRGKVTASALNVRSGASVSNSVIGSLSHGKTVRILGQKNGWYKIRYQGQKGYVAGNYIKTSSSVKDLSADSASSPKKSSWKGAVLNRSNGTVQGPSGKETYYNMNMDNIVSIMRARGNHDKYWVRKDGVKMLGDYVMCAANLKVHPRGSLVETSLGTGIVCDTGGFASSNPHQLDIAVTW